MAPVRASSSTHHFAREAKITGLLPTGKFSRHLLPEFQNTGYPLRFGSEDGMIDETAPVFPGGDSPQGG